MVEDAQNQAPIDDRKFIAHETNNPPEMTFNDKKDEVVQKLNQSGFEIIEVTKDGEWTAVVSKLK